MIETDLRLVRLVGRHFHDLQGLNVALAETVFIGCGLAWLTTNSGVLTSLSIPVAFLALWRPGRRLEKYYAERFGRVGVKTRSLDPSGGVVAVLTWPGIWIERYFAKRFGVVAFHDRSERVRQLIVTVVITQLVVHEASQRAGVCLLILSLAEKPASFVYDGWPYRKHHLLTVGMTVFAAAVLPFYARSPFDGFALAIVLIGIASIVCGFADHALLVRAMRGAKGTIHAEPSAAHPDTE